MRFFGGKREEKEIKEFENMLNSFSINVNQAINFYEVLGGDKLEKENEEICHESFKFH